MLYDFCLANCALAPELQTNATVALVKSTTCFTKIAMQLGKRFVKQAFLACVYDNPERKNTERKSFSFMRDSLDFYFGYLHVFVTCLQAHSGEEPPQSSCSLLQAVHASHSFCRFFRPASILCLLPWKCPRKHVVIRPELRWL